MQLTERWRKPGPQGVEHYKRKEQIRYIILLFFTSNKTTADFMLRFPNHNVRNILTADHFDLIFHSALQRILLQVLMSWLASGSLLESHLEEEISW